jgi:hypothetical protein
MRREKKRVPTDALERNEAGSTQVSYLPIAAKVNRTHIGRSWDKQLADALVTMESALCGLQARREPVAPEIEAQVLN